MFNGFKSKMKRAILATEENPIKRAKKQQISYNPIMKECINDNLIVAYLKLQNIEPEYDEFQRLMMNKGKHYENEVIEYINNQLYPVVSVPPYTNLENYEKTKLLMKQMTPFIHSAKFLHNNRIGEIDLLVLSSHIHLLNPSITIDDTCKPYYIVIDIKFFKINKIKDTQLIRNSNDNVKAAKGQCCFYLQCLNEITGDNHQKAYIIPGPIVKEGLNNIGEIDYSKNDSKFKEDIKLAEKLVQKIYKDYNSIDLNNIKGFYYLYPNMNCESYGYNTIKEKIAIEIGEHTLLPGVTQKAKRNAHKKSIYSFYDINYTPEQIVESYNMSNSKRCNLIKNIIFVNRSESDNIIWKDKDISNVPFSEYKNHNKIFLDFETLDDKIFLIGYYYNISDKWEFKKFISDDASSEQTILDNFYKDYETLNKPHIFYWCADLAIWNRACKRNNFDNLIENDKWIDMYKIFIQNELAIKGCFCYKLKKITNAMVNIGLITNCTNNTSCLNGTDAITQAKSFYDNTINTDEKHNLKKSIIEYNRLDCYILVQIFNYFLKM